MSFFFSLSPDINNFSPSPSSFNQSTEIRLSIVVVCSLVTSMFLSLTLFPSPVSLSLSLSLFLKAKMSSTHFINFTYMRNSPSSPYIPPPIQSMFIHVRIFYARERERKKKRNYILAEEIFSNDQRKKKSMKKAIVCVSFFSFS